MKKKPWKLLTSNIKKKYSKFPDLWKLSHYLLQDNVGGVIEQHPSPQSSPEVNVTNNLKSEVEDHMTSGSQVISVNQSSGVEEEVEVPEPDEAEVSFAVCFCLVRHKK